MTTSKRKWILHKWENYKICPQMIFARILLNKGFRKKFGY